MPEPRYTTYHQIEECLYQAYLRKMPLDIPDLFQALWKHAEGHPAPLPESGRPWGLMSDSEFREIMDSLPIIFREPVYSEGRKNSIQVSEDAAFAVKPGYNKILTHRQYNFLSEQEHTHDYVEVYFVFSGSCRLVFSDADVTLSSGDLIFLAPHSRHRVESFHRGNFILDISIRGSSFESLFLQQLSYDSLLSSFFRKIIYENADLRYILFHTGEDMEVRGLIKQIAMETNLQDTYNEILYTSWANILFSRLMRSFYETVETHPPLENNDFTRVLKYITDHYDSVTLDELTGQFHYTKPHLCNLIKSHTGRTFTALVNAQKLAKAEMLLLTTDYTVEEIAEQVGFTGADYFSRLFQKHYGTTPGKFRRSSREPGPGPSGS